MWLIRYDGQKLIVVYDESQIFSLGDQENAMVLSEVCGYRWRDILEFILILLVRMNLRAGEISE